MSQACTVLLADPNGFLREKIACILLRQTDIWCVVQVCGREPILRSAGEHRPDIILADITLLQDKEMVQQLRSCSPTSRLVAMVEILSEPYVKAASFLGADGIIAKSRISEDIQKEILALNDDRTKKGTESA